QPGENVLPEMHKLLGAVFTASASLRDRARTWARDKRVQLYMRDDGQAVGAFDTSALLTTASEVLYDESLSGRNQSAVMRILEETQRDLLEKVFHKVRYDIDKRKYRYDIVRQSAPGT